MTTSYKKTTPEELLTNLFNTLHTFFNGNFHLGIHGITFSKKLNKMVKWTHPVSWFFQEDLERNAKLSDMAFCLKKNRENLDIWIRPSFDTEDYYILFDDISAEKSVRWSKKPGTLIISTSPGKFQAWRHLDRPMSYEEKMEYIKLEEADAEATPTHRWYRCPGFRNYKAKYAPHFPLARINSVTEGLASLNHLEAVKPAVIRKEYATVQATKINIKRDKYESGNESITDWKYTLALLSLGATDEDIMSRIMSERKNWDNKSAHDSVNEDYVKRTIVNARIYRSR